MSSPEFIAFAHAIQAKLQSMLPLGPKNVFTVEVVDRNDLVDHYLGAFPEGTDPVFRVNTTHNGTYDKNFIRRLGGVVTVTDTYSLDTIWDVPDLPYPYDVVAKAMADHVRKKMIAGRLYVREPVAGHLPNKEKTDSGILEFTHFFARLPEPFFNKKADALISEHRNDVQGYYNALTMVSPESVQTVLDMITDGDLYRGDQFKSVVTEFKSRQDEFLSLPDPLARNRYVNTTSPMKMRSTAIGTLMGDISSDMSLDHALRRYGTSVDPQNYHHSKAPITRGMIEKAMTTINEIGLEPALERRHAVISDISVRDVLWADPQCRSQMAGGVGAILYDSVSDAKPRKEAVTPISIKDFLRTVMPKCTGMGIYLANDLTSKLVNIIAPVHGELPPVLFSWDNNMSWTYNGNVTDSITARVRSAGGKTDGILRVSLAWSTKTDLDLHCFTPTGERIYYRHRKDILDVDANSPYSTLTETPVENMNFRHLQDGEYVFQVHNYENRSTTSNAFTLEVAIGDSLTHFYMENGPRTQTGVQCLKVVVVNGMPQSIQIENPALQRADVSKSVWGVTTEKFTRVASIMYSPNYWESATGQDGVHGDDENDDRGNRHYFFIIDNCRNPEPCRGIFNEYLRPNLMPYRKVFEVIGNKTMVQPADEQLCGLGFSSTIRAKFLVRATTLSGMRFYEVSV